MVESILRTNHADTLSVSSQYFPPVCISTPHFEALKQNQNLILRFWRQTAIFKSSFWGLDTEIKATKCRFGSGISTECSKWALGGTANLPSGQNVHPEMKPQILRFSRQRKRLTRDFAFPPLSEICRNVISMGHFDPLISSGHFDHLISPPGIHKEFLEKSRKIW